MNTPKEKIKEFYSDALTVRRQKSCCEPSSSCCGQSGASITGFNEDYSHMPGYDPRADYGLGCGIPVQFASIKSGDVVLDLGSGAGNDAFVARSFVEDNGKVIGVDMTPAMIEQANRNKEKLLYKNVEFIVADIEKLPIENSSVDVVISNCVLNLVSDKLTAYREIFRVLKPGGHFSISDIVLTGTLTTKIRKVAELYAGCISGAVIRSQYIDTIREAGFVNVTINKEKLINLPDDFLLQFLSTAELADFRQTGVQILSVTVSGERGQ